MKLPHSTFSFMIGKDLGKFSSVTIWISRNALPENLVTSIWLTTNQRIFGSHCKRFFTWKCHWTETTKMLGVVELYSVDLVCWSGARNFHNVHNSYFFLPNLGNIYNRVGSGTTRARHPGSTLIPSATSISRFSLHLSTTFSISRSIGWLLCSLPLEKFDLFHGTGI